MDAGVVAREREERGRGISDILPPARTKIPCAVAVRAAARARSHLLGVRSVRGGHCQVGLVLTRGRVHVAISSGAGVDAVGGPKPYPSDR
jgi:hypothetical protein